MRLPRRLTTLSLLAPTLVATALLGAVATFPAAEAQPAAPAPASPTTLLTMSGNDVSWPQCAKHQGGYDLPLPARGAGFVVVGLTKGLPFQENPCLDAQLAHAQSLSARVAVYSFAAYPTRAQLATQGTAGPYDASTRGGRLSNAGYAQGAWTVATLAKRALSAPFVWLDVEPRKVQNWPRTDQAGNRAVLAGAVKALQDAGYGVGFYSYANGWKQITGGMRSALPVWATAGRRGRAAAEAMCDTASFSGGPVMLAQWYDSVRDSDVTCPRMSGAVTVAASELSAYRSMVLSRGDRGTAVAALQRRFGLAVSGNFNSALEKKVRAFQKERRLAADGVVGPKTWKALGATAIRVVGQGAGQLEAFFATP